MPPASRARERDARSTVVGAAQGAGCVLPLPRLRSTLRGSNWQAPIPVVLAAIWQAVRHVQRRSPRHRKPRPLARQARSNGLAAQNMLVFYHIRSFDDGWGISANFSPAGTAQDGLTANGPGFTPASFVLGTLDLYAPWVGETAADQTENWYGWYAQDQWQVTRNLGLTAGICWDYVSPPNYHRGESGLDMATGQVCITGAVFPQFPKATCPSGYFSSRYN